MGTMEEFHKLNEIRKFWKQQFCIAIDRYTKRRWYFKARWHWYDNQTHHAMNNVFREMYHELGPDRAYQFLFDYQDGKFD